MSYNSNKMQLLRVKRQMAKSHFEAVFDQRSCWLSRYPCLKEQQCEVGFCRLSYEIQMYLEQKIIASFIVAHKQYARVEALTYFGLSVPLEPNIYDELIQKITPSDIAADIPLLIPCFRIRLLYIHQAIESFFIYLFIMSLRIELNNLK